MEWDVRVITVVPGAWRGVQVGVVVVGRLDGGPVEAKWGARWSVPGGGRGGGEFRRLRATPALAGVHWVCIEWEDSVVEEC